MSCIFLITATLWQLHAVTSRHETEHRRARLSFDERVQLKNELIKLEKKILDITGDPIDYKHYSPFLDWCRDDAKVEAVEEIMLDRSYILNLLFDVHCTPAEVARLEKLNGMLLEMANRTYHRTADMMRALMVMKKDDMDIDDLMVGHSYFMTKLGELPLKWEYEIYPLLNEYYKDGICSKAPQKDMTEFIAAYKNE